MIARKVFEKPEVYRIEVPFPNIATSETNAYVIRDGGEALVVDMGAPTDEAAERFIGALAEIGMAPNDASYFFTHLHLDHSGLASMLLDPDAPIFLGEMEMRSASPEFANRMADHVKQRLQDEGMTLHQAEEKAALIEIATPLAKTHCNLTPLAPGEQIAVGSFKFQVVGLPGHTRGMSGLFQPDSGLCFSGDQLLFCITPTCGLFLDGVDSVAAYEESMASLMSLPITHLFHSHGEIRADFRERAASIMSSKTRRMDRICEFVRDNPGLSGMDVVRNMGWRIPFASIDECEQRQQWLIYTQGIALLDHLVLEGRIERVREPALTGNAAVLNTYR